MSKPAIVAQHETEFENISWQSRDAARIADELKNRYNDKTLTKNQAQFLSQVKSSLDSQLGEKIDSWQFWLDSQWPTLDDKLASELLEEKLGQLSTKDYERRKEQLASEIKKAQESGDINKVKELMKVLSDLAKER